MTGTMLVDMTFILAIYALILTAEGYICETSVKRGMNNYGESKGVVSNLRLTKGLLFPRYNRKVIQIEQFTTVILNFTTSNVRHLIF